MDNLTKLRYWTFKILPLVYDDSLSYYEVLTKVTAKINELIDSNNSMPQAITTEVKKQLSSDELATQIMNGLVHAIATDEGTKTFTTNAKSGGELIFLNGTLYKVIAVMPAGTNYIVGTNIVPVNIYEELKTIKETYLSSNNEHWNERSANNYNEGVYLFWKDVLYITTKDIHTNDILYIDGDNKNLKQVTLTSEITNHYNEMHKADNNLQTQITAEVTNRKTADATLQNNIDEVQAAVTNEKNVRFNADNSLRKAIDTINGSPSGSSIVVDKSLSIDGAGADAKTVGDILKNVDLLADGTEIPTGSDLNAYKKVGNYYVRSDGISSSIENIPEHRSGQLKVYIANGDIYHGVLAQHYITSYSKCFNEYKRVFWNDSWTNWIKVASNVDENFFLKGGTEIPAGSDFNDYKKVGNYYVISDAISTSIKNIPFHSSGLLKVYSSNGASDNSTQHFISSNSKHYNEYKRNWFLNTWYPWVKVAGINVSHASMNNKLTVMTYNVQWFSRRNANTIMQDAIIRKFNPDIIGLQEFREYTPADTDVSVTSGMDVWSTIFKDYEYTHLAKEGNANYKGNASKFEMIDIVDKEFNVNNGEKRGYTKCYITVNGKKICWINAHLATTSLQADKIAQAHQIVELVKNEPYFIVTGDFNTRSEPELGEFNSIMKPFLDIGANTANFKAADNYIFTCYDGNDPSSGSKFPHDHIITSANISIDKVFADNTKYMSMFMDSNPIDHVPLVAFLTVN